MTRICLVFGDLVSRMSIRRADRVRGAFHRVGQSGAQALRDVLALVSGGRQLCGMTGGLGSSRGLIIPLGMLLSILSWTKAGLAPLPLDVANNWDWLLDGQGFCTRLLTPSRSSLIVSYCWLLVMDCRFVLGFYVAQIRQVYGLLFCLMLVFGCLVARPSISNYLVQQMRAG